MRRGAGLGDGCVAEGDEVVVEGDRLDRSAITSRRPGLNIRTIGLQQLDRFKRSSSEWSSEIDLPFLTATERRGYSGQLSSGPARRGTRSRSGAGLGDVLVADSDEIVIRQDQLDRSVISSRATHVMFA
jgi:hypothetical protein